MKNITATIEVLQLNESIRGLTIAEVCEDNKRFYSAFYYDNYRVVPPQRQRVYLDNDDSETRDYIESDCLPKHTYINVDPFPNSMGLFFSDESRPCLSGSFEYNKDLIKLVDDNTHLYELVGKGQVPEFAQEEVYSYITKDTQTTEGLIEGRLRSHRVLSESYINTLQQIGHNSNTIVEVLEELLLRGEIDNLLRKASKVKTYHSKLITTN